MSASPKDSSSGDTSSDDEHCTAYRRVAVSLAINRLKIAREHEMKRQTEPVEASTSETKRCRSRNRARQSKPTSEVHHETVDVSSSLDEVENKFSTIAVYGFHGSKCHFFTFNVPRNEPLNSLRNQISTGLNASIRGLRFRLHGELVSGQESLEQLGVGKTECLEFEIDDLLIDLKFVAPEQDKVALSVNQDPTSSLGDGQ